MKFIHIIILSFWVSSFLLAQNIQVKINRYESEGEDRSTLSVYFIDTITRKKVDSLDLYDLNPYNHLQFESRSTNWANNKMYQIKSFDEFDKLFPADYRQKYFVDYYVEPGKYCGLISSTIALSSYDRPANYIAVAYSLFAQPNYSDQIDGAISTIFVFDNRKNIVYKKENVLCVNNEIAVSDDGRYVAYCYGAAWSDGQLIKDGIQIVNTKTGTIVFEDDKGYVDGPSGGYYPDLIQFTCNLGDYFVRDYYFNTKTSKLYSLYYNRLENENTLIDIKPDGLLYKDKNSKEYFLLFEKSFDVQTVY